MEHFLLAFGLALGINLLMFLPAYYFKTDKLTDISYALTFTVLAIFSWYGSPRTPFDTILLVMILLWAFRLGMYLMVRIRTIGRDRRFDGMREDFKKFAGFWVFQGVSVFIIMVPAMLFAGSGLRATGMFFWSGLLIYTSGLIIETVSDRQKFTFLNDPGNQGRWVSTGLWRFSRHPNYLGEIMVWLGIYLYAIQGLSFLQGILGVVSPMYISLLLIFVSGIPMLEASAHKKWSQDPEFQAYQKTTGLLVPKGVLQLLVAILIAQLAGIIGAGVTETGAGSWYQELVKPEWNPPGWVFGPVWGTLYVLMGVAAFLVWRQRKTTSVGLALVFFIIQLGLNSLWSIIFFGFQNPGLALIEIIILLAAIKATTLTFYRISKAAAWLLVPYMGWTTFAAVLNYAIWRLN